MNLLNLSQFSQGAVNNDGEFIETATTYSAFKYVPVLSNTKYGFSIIIKNMTYFQTLPSLYSVTCYNEDCSSYNIMQPWITGDISMHSGSQKPANVLCYSFTTFTDTKFIIITINNGEDTSFNSVTSENFLNNVAARLSIQMADSDDLFSADTTYASNIVNNINKQGQLETTTFTEGFSTAQIGKSSIVLGNQLYEF